MVTKTKTNKKYKAVDYAQQFTDFILDNLTNPALKNIPWNNGYETGADITETRPHNPVTKVYYSGKNIMMLDMIKTIKNYPNNKWMTYGNAKTLSTREKPVHVIKGEKATYIYRTLFRLVHIKCEQFGGTEDKPVYTSDYKTNVCSNLKTSKNKKGCYRAMSGEKSFPVFNVAQIEGLPKKFYEVPKILKPTKTQKSKALLKAEKVFKKYIKNEGIKHIEKMDFTGAPFYQESSDSITTPSYDSGIWKKSTKDEIFIEVILHESGQSTGAKTRLNREHKYHTNHGRGCEEFVAELTAGILMTELGIKSPEKNTNIMAYLQGWATALRTEIEKGKERDNKLLGVLIAQAHKSAKMILKGGK